MKYLRQSIRQILLEQESVSEVLPLPENILTAIQNYGRKSIEACGIPQVYDYMKDRKTHPNAGKCRGSARGLALAIDRAAGKKVARMIGGWFRSASTDYYYPSQGYRTYPPSSERKPGEQWEEHWWVEVMGWYVDVTANQFFPKDPEKQKEFGLVITPANLEKYYPNRRRPLMTDRDLSPEMEKLAKRLSTLKKARSWKRNPREALRWFRKFGPKYGLSDFQSVNLASTIRHERFNIDFSDIEQVRNLIREIL